MAVIADRTRVWDIDNLLRNYQKGRENGNGIVYRNQLVECFLPLVRAIAQKIGSKMPPEIEWDDLEGYGVLGLIDAVECYDSKKGTKFVAYARHRISGTIKDCLRKSDFVPRLARDRQTNVERACRNLASKFGYEPTEELVINELKREKYVDYCFRDSIKEGKTKKAEGIFRGSFPVKTQSLYSKCTHNGSILLDCLEDRNISPPSKLDNEDAMEFIMGGLAQDNKKILNMYYVSDMPMKKIAKILGVSSARISQRYKKIIEHLRKSFEIRGIDFEKGLELLAI